MTTIEKTNRNVVKTILNSICDNNLHYVILPLENAVEVKCYDKHTYDVVGNVLDDDIYDDRLSSIDVCTTYINYTN